LADHEITSITAYRDYHFHARNDEGTPYDISKNGGGKVDAYRQQSQELRLASKQGGFVDYQVGALFFRNIVDFGQGGYNAGWGSDAGAWFASNLQYNALDVNGSGRALLADSLDGVTKRQAQYVKNKSLGLYGQADWHFSERATLTTGVRFTREDRRNSADSLIVDYGKGGQWLNPVTLNGIPLGGFNSVAFNGTTYSAANPNAGTAGNLTGSNSATQIALANRVAQKYFGVADYNSLTQQQKAQVAAAKAVRQGQFGTLWALTESPAFRKTQPGLNISPSYKLNDDQTTYVALQYGEKGAVAQIVNGTPRQADPEKVTSLEWGLKSALLNKTLFLNFDLFQSNVRGYQQSVSIPDAPGSATLATYTGNADKVVIRGLELDGAYTGWRYITVRFSGAYNEAKYKSFTNSPTPAEYETAGVLDQSGAFLSGASRLLFNLGAEYRRPVPGDKVFHTSFNTAFKGRFNSDNNLSQYAWINSRVLADASIGIGRADGKFDVNLIVKNVFDDRTPQAVTWNSITPGDQRWIGIQFSGKL
jgi:outer membrane receptor protein involved in Fe transport